MRDAWLLVGEAIGADLPVTARADADRAVELSGWDRYPLGTSQFGAQVRCCDLLPAGWVYYTAAGWDSLLLVDRRVMAMVMGSPGLPPLMHEAHCLGGGLLRLETLMDAFVFGGFAEADRVD
jgi:hypothetical protein